MWKWSANWERKQKYEIFYNVVKLTSILLYFILLKHFQIIVYITNFTYCMTVYSWLLIESKDLSQSSPFHPVLSITLKHIVR